MEEIINNLKKTILVEYSVRQDSFNINTLEEILTTNIRQSLQKIDSDYKIIGVFGNYEEASNFVSMFREEIFKIQQKDEEIERLTKLLEEKDNE